MALELEDLAKIMEDDKKTQADQFAKYEKHQEHQHERVFEKLEANAISLAESRVEIKNLREDIKEQAKGIGENRSAISLIKEKASGEAAKTAIMVAFVVSVTGTILTLAFKSIF